MCLAPSWLPENRLIPVTLPPGRLSVSTKPDLTGSSPLTKTIGIVPLPLSSPVRREARRQRPLPPDGAPARPLGQLTGHSDPPPTDTRSSRRDLRRTRPRSVRGGTHPPGVH